MAEVTIIVDGQKVQAASGSLLIDVCKRAGIEVPSFCYYPGLSLQGAVVLSIKRILPRKCLSYHTAPYGAYTKEKSMDYTFLADLHKEFAPPEDGILSRILHKDEKVNVTLFGFSSGQELSAHSAPTPAILYFLDGDAEVQLGEDKVNAQPGSFVYMPPMLTHGILAKSPVRMLLIQIRAGTN